MVLFELTLCSGELYRPLCRVSSREIIGECHGVVVDINRFLESDFVPNLALKEHDAPLVGFRGVHQAVSVLIKTFIRGLCHIQDLRLDILLIDKSFCRSLTFGDSSFYIFNQFYVFLCRTSRVNLSSPNRLQSLLQLIVPIIRKVSIFFFCSNSFSNFLLSLDFELCQVSRMLGDLLIYLYKNIPRNSFIKILLILL